MALSDAVAEGEGRCQVAEPKLHRTARGRRGVVQPMPGVGRNIEVDLSALGELLGRSVALEAAAAAASLGASASRHAAALATGAAPDFTLPDLAGRPHTLSAYRGKKVLLIAYASW